MAWYSSLGDMADTARLSEELSALRDEMSLIQRKLRKAARSGRAAAGERGSEFYDELRERVSDAMPAARRQAMAAGRFAHDNRTALIVGTAAVVGLLAILAMRRRD